jgi:polyhydroxyalkanoate synthesis regulator phasin
MAQRDVLKRYLDAGMAFGDMTRARAEGIVKDLVKAGELPRKRAEKSIEELVEASRRNTDAIVALVQSQVKEQLSSLGLATKDDIARLEAKIAGAARTPAPAKKAPAVKKAAAKKV